MTHATIHRCENLRVSANFEKLEQCDVDAAFEAIFAKVNSTDRLNKVLCEFCLVEFAGWQARLCNRNLVAFKRKNHTGARRIYVLQYPGDNVADFEAWVEKLRKENVGYTITVRR